MHGLGKVFTWLAAAGAIAAILLTGRMLQVRDSWTRQLDQYQKQYEESVAERDKNRKELTELQAELARTLVGWDRYWNGVPVNPTGADGSLETQLGEQFGLAENQVVYGFRLGASGNESTYTGAFRVTGLTPDGVRSAMQPDWRVRPGQTDKPNEWAGNWRFRTLIPPSRIGLFTDFEVGFLEADERLDDRRRNLVKQKELQAGAEERLKQRMAELLGNQALADQREDLPVWMVDGLIATIQREEEARNTLQVRVDRLRRQVDVAHRRYEQLQKENRGLVTRLPGSQPSPAAGAVTKATN